MYLFLEKGKGRRKRGTETSMCGCLLCAPYWGPGMCPDMCNPGMCPDWELNWQPFGSQAHAQSTELHQPGILHKTLNDPPSSTILNILGYSGYLYIILT